MSHKFQKYFLCSAYKFFYLFLTEFSCFLLLSIWMVSFSNPSDWGFKFSIVCYTMTQIIKFVHLLDFIVSYLYHALWADHFAKDLAFSFHKIDGDTFLLAFLYYGQISFIFLSLTPSISVCLVTINNKSWLSKYVEKTNPCRKQLPVIVQCSSSLSLHRRYVSSKYSGFFTYLFSVFLQFK